MQIVPRTCQRRVIEKIYNETSQTIDRLLSECGNPVKLTKLTINYQHNNNCAIQVYEAAKILLQASAEDFHSTHLREQIRTLGLDQEDIETSKRLGFANAVFTL